MNRPDVMVVGSYVQDNAWFVDQFPQSGETRRASAFNTGPGGKGFNQAIACARQGVATAFIGSIGDDYFGTVAQRFASEAGLPCRWQMHRDQPTSASSIIVNAQGENRIAVSLGANEHLDPDFVCAQNYLFTSAHILLLQLENNLDAIATALDLGTRHGLTRLLNPAPADGKLELALLQHVDILTPNETEFAHLLKRSADISIDPFSLTRLADADLHDLARQLRVPTVVITLGAAGCFVSHAQKPQRGDVESYYRLPAERVKTIDSTGAGDAFSGALAAALVLFPDKPFRDAAIYANRVAALSTETIGTAPAMPTHAAVCAHFYP